MTAILKEYRAESTSAEPYEMSKMYVDISSFVSPPKNLSAGSGCFTLALCGKEVSLSNYRVQVI
jgi:hypothetical protein